MELCGKNVNLLFFDTVNSNYKAGCPPPHTHTKIIEKQTQLHRKLLEEQGPFILLSRSRLGLRGYLISDKEQIDTGKHDNR